MCGFLRARVARLVSVEMQGKLDILAENAGEDGFVAGVCFLQDGFGGGPCFLQDDSAERRSGAGCLPRLMLSMSLRFVTTLMDDSIRIMNAQKARGVDFGEGSIIQKVKAMISSLIPLCSESKHCMISIL